MTVEEALPGVGYAAVSGQEKQIKRIAKQYAPDPILELQEPVANVPVPADAAEARDEPLYPFQWDKQDLDIPDAQNVSQGEDVRVAVIDSGVAADHPDLDDVNLKLSENFSGEGLGVGYPYGGL